MARGRLRQIIWVALSFAGLIAVGLSGVLGASRPVFIQAVVSGLLIGSVYSLVAMGLSLVFGVLDIINFAHGALMTIGVYAGYLLFTGWGVDPYLALLVAVPLLLVIGMGLQRFVINPVMTAPAHNQLLLTLGIAIVIENLALMLFTGTPRSIQLPYDRGSLDLGFVTLDFPLQVFGAVVTLPKLLAFLVALILAGLLYLLITKTLLGTAIRAAAQEPEGAAMVGIDVGRIYTITFGIGAACAGAAGVLVLPFLFVSPTVGTSFTIISFIVVVLGGMGSIPGALMGGLIVGLTQELTQIYVIGSSKLLGVFAVFLLVLFFRPEGLFGEPST